MDDLRDKIIKKAFDYREHCISSTDRLSKLSDEDVLALAEDKDFLKDSNDGMAITMELFALLNELEALGEKPS